MSGLRNIPLRKYKKFLKSIGCKHTRTSGGHEHWTRSDVPRPITLQTHINPVPEFIIKIHLRQLNTTKDQFIKMIAKM